MTASQSWRAATTPAWTAAPYPGLCSRTTRAPSRSATATVSSVDPLSTTMTSKVLGDARQEVDQGGPLVLAGQDEVAARARSGGLRGIHGTSRYGLVDAG